MTRLRLAVLALLAVPSLASAAGRSLAWDNCFPGGGHSDKIFACNTNSDAEAHTLVVSFTPPAGITAFVGIETEIVVWPDNSVLPPWWEVKGVGRCRDGQVVASADFSSGPFGCTDPWLGSASGPLSVYNIGFPNPNNARLAMLITLSNSAARALNEGEEYYAVKVTILNAKTIGAGSCTGCALDACLSLRNLSILQTSGTPGGDVDIFDSWSDEVGWNDPWPLVCMGVPTRTTTWGSIKSLYR